MMPIVVSVLCRTQESRPALSSWSRSAYSSSVTGCGSSSDGATSASAASSDAPCRQFGFHLLCHRGEHDLDNTRTFVLMVRLSARAIEVQASSRDMLSDLCVQLTIRAMHQGQTH